MVNIDEYKSTKNRSLITNATFKMIKDKYNIDTSNNSVAETTFLKIINNIINVIGNDVILLNRNIKISEINNLTLFKIKEYIEKHMNTIDNNGSDESNGITDDKGNNIKEDIVNIDNNIQVLSDDNELINKLHDLEEKRRASSALLNDLLNNSKNTHVFENSNKNHEKTEIDTQSNENISLTQYNAITDIIYKKICGNTSSINTKKNKLFIVKSNNRDWVNNPSRNVLQFNVNINITDSIICPHKILFPTFVKDITSFIAMHITDSIIVQKYYFVFEQSNGFCDVWKPLLQNPENIILTSKSWRISFFDCMNNKLSLGEDGTDVVEVSNADGYLNGHFNIKLDNNVHEYLHFFKDRDNILLFSFNSKFVPLKIVKKNDDNNIIVYNNELKLEDFLKSKILNSRLQYSIFFTYYTND
jgi:hypothetical protein